MGDDSDFIDQPVRISRDIGFGSPATLLRGDRGSIVEFDLLGFPVVQFERTATRCAVLWEWLELA
jgi:hypothetical protein